MTSPGNFALSPEEVDAIKASVRADFVRLLKSQWRDARTGDVNKAYNLEMIKHDYSLIRPQTPGLFDKREQTGAEKWEDVDRYSSVDGYYLPITEKRMIRSQKTFFRNLTSVNTVIDLGPGGQRTVEDKALPTVNALSDPKKYIAFDINSKFAHAATEIVGKRRPDIETMAVSGDFTQPYNFPAGTIQGTPLMTMYGSTITQFPFNGGGTSPFHALLSNLGRMVDHNGYFVFTIDANSTAESILKAYQDPVFVEFKEHLWKTVKECVGDPNFDASAFKYRPEYDSTNRVIRHRYIVEKDVTVTVDGESYGISAGTHLYTGVSQKWGLQEVIDALAKQDGWQHIGTLNDGKSTVRGLVLAGKNLPKQNLMTAKIG